MTRKAIALAAVFGLVAVLVAAALLSTRFAGSGGSSGPLDVLLARPRSATPAEQRELMRLSLRDAFERADEHASEGADAAPASSDSPRLALSLVPYRSCVPVPSLRRCEPDAHGRTLLSEEPPVGSKLIKRAPMKLREALVHIEPPAARLPDPELPRILVIAPGRKLTEEEENLVMGLFRGEVPGGVGYASMSWAIVSADGKTALMDVHVNPGDMTLELFQREKTGWRRVHRLRY